MNCAVCANQGEFYHSDTDKFYCESCYADMLESVRAEISRRGNDIY